MDGGVIVRIVMTHKKILGTCKLSVMYCALTQFNPIKNTDRVADCSVTFDDHEQPTICHFIGSAYWLAGFISGLESDTMSTDVQS